MTNVITALIVTVYTNWIPVETTKGTKEVGIIIQDTHLQVTWKDMTNKYILESQIISQLNVREKNPVAYGLTNFWIPPYIIVTNLTR